VQVARARTLVERLWGSNDPADIARLEMLCDVAPFDFVRLQLICPTRPGKKLVIFTS
jgi:hypothetical protein